MNQKQGIYNMSKYFKKTQLSIIPELEKISMNQMNDNE